MTTSKAYKITCLIDPSGVENNWTHQYQINVAHCINLRTHNNLLSSQIKDLYSILIKKTQQLQGDVSEQQWREIMPRNIDQFLMIKC